MTTLNILKAVSKRFDLPEPDQNGIATFDLCHLLFACLNHPAISEALCQQNLSPKIWRVNVKGRIKKFLRKRVDFDETLAEVDFNRLMLMLHRIAQINEGMRHSFQRDGFSLDVGDWTKHFYPSKHAPVGYTSVLTDAQGTVLQLTQDELQEIMMVAGAYNAKFLPETFQVYVPHLTNQLLQLCKTFNIKLVDGDSGLSELFLHLKQFQTGHTRFRDTLIDLPIHNDEFMQFLCDTAPIQMTRIKKPAKVAKLTNSQSQFVKQINAAVKVQFPIILLQTLYDSGLSLRVDHVRLTEFSLKYLEAVARNDVEIHYFFDQVCNQFPTILSNVEGANYLFELASGMIQKPRLAKQTRLAVFAKLHLLFKEPMNQNPDLAILFGIVEASQTTPGVSQDQLDAILRMISGNYYSGALYFTMMQCLLNALYHGPEQNLQRLMRPNNEKLLKHIVKYGPAENVASLLKRLKQWMPLDVFNRYLLLRPELLQDHNQLLTLSLGNPIVNHLRSSWIGRYILTDKDQFPFDELISLAPDLLTRYINVLLTNPTVRAGFLASQAIEQCDAKHFALFYSQVMQMCQSYQQQASEMGDDADKSVINNARQVAEQFAARLLRRRNGKVKPAIVNKLLVGLASIDHGIMRNMSCVLIALERNFNPVDPIGVLTAYLNGAKQHACRNLIGGKHYEYHLPLPTPYSSYDELFVTILKTRLRGAVDMAFKMNEYIPDQMQLEHSLVHVRIKKLAQALFHSPLRHPRFCDFLSFLITSGTFNAVPHLDPIVVEIKDALLKSDVDVWSVILSHTEHLQFTLEETSNHKLNVKFKWNTSSLFVLEDINPSATVRSMIADYQVQRSQEGYTLEQLRLAETVHRLSGKMSTVTVDELLSVINWPNAIPSTVLTLMTSEYFPHRVHELTFTKPGLATLVTDYLNQMRERADLSLHAKSTVEKVLKGLGRPVPVHLTTTQLNKLQNDWRRPQAPYFVWPIEPQPLVPAVHLHPTTACI